MGRIFKVSQQLEATFMNKTIKTIINVIPIFLVPLILERQKAKAHPDVQNVKNATIRTSKTVAHKTSAFTSHVKDKVVTNSSEIKETMMMRKRRHDYNKAMKQEADRQRELRPENVRKRGQKLQKENRNEISKMNKKLQKSIDKRHKEEQKDIDKRHKQLQKNMEKMQKYERKVGYTPHSLDQQTEIRGEKLEKQNKKEVQKMNKKLQKSIKKRHKAEEKAAQDRQKQLKKDMENSHKHDTKSSHHSTLDSNHHTTQEGAHRIKTLSELKTIEAQSGEKPYSHSPKTNQPTSKLSNHQHTTSDDDLDHASLFETHYQNMAQHIAETQHTDQDEALNRTSKNSVKKQER